MAASADQTLAPAGGLARAIPHYEDRPGQRQMAQAVERAIADNRPLMVEAGTGVGKTLAYLIPALMSGKRVVVSTGTRALQDQIARHDLPLLRTLLPAPFGAALLKGVSNYVCLRKAQLPAHTLARRALGNWLSETATGDRAEVEWLGEEDPRWRELTTSPEQRLGSRCPHYERCFVTTARRAAEKANLIIVNHHLYFADLALRANGNGAKGKLLPAHDVVIFDEAHQLEDVATEHFGVRISAVQLHQVARDADEALHDMALFIGTAGQDLVRAVDTAGAQLMSLVRAQLLPTVPPGGLTRGARMRLPTSLFADERQLAWYGLDNALEALARECEGHSEPGPDEDEGLTAMRGSLATLARRLRGLRDDLALIAEQRQAAHVFWGELSLFDTALIASPVVVGELIRRRIVHGEATAIFTSATLSTNGNFAYARARLGLRPDEVDAIAVPSPFDYGRQAMLYLPRDLPPPSEAGYPQEALARIRELLAITDGRAFVLCTSHGHLGSLAQALRDTQYELFVQGQAPRATLVEQFRGAKRGVLLGTGAFWEGIDVPGDQLSLVIIDKLPFAPHTDPLVEARATHERAAGREPFVTYQIPATAITLRQGVGRLIRRRDDCGLLAILDSRLVTKRYGAILLASLPPALRRTSELEPLRRFWRELTTPTPPA